MTRAYVLAIGWTLGIMAACSIPGNDLPDLDIDLLRPDKIVHFSLFMGLGWLWLRALPQKLPYRFALVLGLGALYAIGTEVYQGLLPWDRTPDPLDAAANLIGLFTAAGVQHWIERKRWQ
ncbi:MAG: VanZ family protein [Rhodothermales bacterium]|nr:VanZ family protein [Rhodothermales bacterium]